MASSSSVSVPPLMKEEEPRNWAELPHVLTSSILLLLDVDEILLSAQKVCRSWRRVCKDPSLWRKIGIRSVRVRFKGIRDLDFDSLCRHVVDLSQGGLLEINVSDFGSNDLLSYIADRSSNLRSLGFDIDDLLVPKKGLVNAKAKLPMFEELEVSSYSWLVPDLKAIGQACPHLRTLKRNSRCYVHTPIKYDCDDDDALVIAGSMLELRHLQLLGNRITDIGLNAILDNLPHLKHLDLRMCLNINFAGDLKRRCLETIKELRLPHDSTSDCPFVISFLDFDNEDFCEDDF